MKLFFQCLFSPRLYKIYRDGSPDNMYQPLRLEKLADRVITSAHTIVNIAIYTSPFICMYIYKRGFSVIDENKIALVRFFGGIGCLLALFYVIRGMGRVYNQKYVDFVKALNNPTGDKESYLEGIRKFDFEFYAWPSTYNIPAKPSPSWLQKHPFLTSANNDLPLYQRVPIQLLAFIATHAFGLRLVYPGSLGLISNLFWTPLFQGRTQLVEEFNGQRTKLTTADGNNIDTMFVDHRKLSVKGKYLVICCEGNSGFYEIGIMATPIKAGYSAMGWNHPGFAGSTGLPYPSQEQNAIDAVLQYAINELKFQPENVVMFGWSIGGYSATWAAINYPVRGLILDAIFDDLLPLAQNVMPSSWSLLVKEVIRSYVNLNIAEMLKKYNGSVQLVRRTEDEVICLRPGIASTNRGNELVMSLIEHRHPINDDIKPEAWKKALLKHVQCLEEKRPTVDSSELSEYDRRALMLISKYTRDFCSTHCIPLSVEHFEDIMNTINRASIRSNL
ncbi:phosphatidylserine lipase ABHD16A [Achroia grisella]|uniref:phosphatidylserine lipase ABHD16A n=1 Tax=Achroia grisella TaxID=688607 RepID=UPI0027D25CFB|nr:phosphatidylserine lipase ABHD16A [Achroia grisella]XP_059055142.1 phosphatidylserine lipase ABHD16A [Achroia grisella]